MEGLEEQHQLEKLELYDNHIEVIQGIDHLKHLKILDLSFNAIREMVNLATCCPLLEEVYVAQNKLRTINGLEGLVHLRVLDLGANRIRVSLYTRIADPFVLMDVFNLPVRSQHTRVSSPQGSYFLFPVQAHPSSHSSPFHFPYFVMFSSLYCRPLRDCRAART
jgi:Leucine-rich repeat (LRR) protein